MTVEMEKEAAAMCNLSELIAADELAKLREEKDTVIAEKDAEIAKMKAEIEELKSQIEARK